MGRSLRSVATSPRQSSIHSMHLQLLLLRRAQYPRLCCPVGDVYRSTTWHTSGGIMQQNCSGSVAVILCSALSFQICQWRQELGCKGLFLLQGSLVKLDIWRLHFEHGSNVRCSTGVVRVIIGTTETNPDSKWGSSGHPVPGKGVWGNSWQLWNIPFNCQSTN